MLRSTWFHIGSACMKASPSATASLIQSRTGPLARKDSWPERIGLVEGVGMEVGPLAGEVRPSAHPAPAPESVRRGLPVSRFAEGSVLDRPDLLERGHGPILAGLVDDVETGAACQQIMLHLGREGDHFGGTGGTIRPRRDAVMVRVVLRWRIPVVRLQVPAPSTSKILTGNKAPPLGR